MKYARLALAAVAATVFDACYGFLVYGTLLAPEFTKYPSVYRSEVTGPAYMPLMFGGLFVALAFSGVNYATLNLGRKLALEVAAAGFVEWTVVGTIIGLVYKPAA